MNNIGVTILSRRYMTVADNHVPNESYLLKMMRELPKVKWATEKSVDGLHMVRIFHHDNQTVTYWFVATLSPADATFWELQSR